MLKPRLKPYSITRHSLTQCRAKTCANFLELFGACSSSPSVPAQRNDDRPAPDPCDGQDFRAVDRVTIVHSQTVTLPPRPFLSSLHPPRAARTLRPAAHPISSRPSPLPPRSLCIRPLSCHKRSGHSLVVADNQRFFSFSLAPSLAQPSLAAVSVSVGSQKAHSIPSYPPLPPT